MIFEITSNITDIKLLCFLIDCCLTSLQVTADSLLCIPVYCLSAFQMPCEKCSPGLTSQFNATKTWLQRRWRVCYWAVVRRQTETVLSAVCLAAGKMGGCLDVTMSSFPSKICLLYLKWTTAQPSLGSPNSSSSRLAKKMQATLELTSLKKESQARILRLLFRKSSQCQPRRISFSLWLPWICSTLSDTQLQAPGSSSLFAVSLEKADSGESPTYLREPVSYYTYPHSTFRYNLISQYVVKELDVVVL